MDQAEHSVGPFTKAEGGLSRVTCICGESLTGEVVDVVAWGAEHVNPGMGEFARDLYGSPDN
jgi:hypothetical protein